MKRFGEQRFSSIEEHINFCLDNVLAPDGTLEEIGRFYEEAAEQLRAQAILRLLVDADVEGFAADLVTSGFARRALLKRAARERYDGYLLAVGRSGSVFDALAAEAPDLAGQFLSLSPASWRPEDEYEDDFQYQRFLGLLALGAPAAELDRAFGLLEKAAGGAGGRLEVCGALRAKDAALFEKAFERRLEERRSEVEEDRALAEDDLAVALGSKVFVEGIATLKLARAAGLPTEREYPMCPWLALLPHPPQQPSDPFAGS